MTSSSSSPSSPSLFKVLGGRLRTRSFSRACTCRSGPVDSEAALLGLDPYRYPPLSRPLSSRVFELYAGQCDQPIRGALHEIGLERDGDGDVSDGKAPTERWTYIALSYAWGDSRKAHLIECDGCYIAITCSLHSALLRLRQFEAHVIVFADAICINQGTDNAAIHLRAVQVRMMDRIFGDADRVVVDLGAERDNSPAVVDLLARIASINEEEWQANAHDYQKGLAAGMPVANDPLWSDLVAFAARPWFERTWVIQEVALPVQVIFMVGQDQLSLETLNDGVLRCGFFYCLAPTNNLQAVRNKEYGDRQLISSITQSMYLLGRINKLRKGCQDEDVSPLGVGDLLRLTCDFKATDSRDKVYSILGMAKAEERDVFVIDYQESIKDLSRRLTTFLIDRGELVQMLNYHAALDAGLEASWMVDLTILDRVKQLDREANWTWLSEDGYNGAISDIFNACGDFKCRHVKPAGEANLLFVSGGFLTEIKDLSEPRPQRKNHWYVPSALAIRKTYDWDRKAYEVASRHLAHLPKSELMQLYRRTLVADARYLQSGVFGLPIISADLPGHIAAVEDVMSFIASPKLKDAERIMRDPKSSVMNMAIRYLGQVALNCSTRRVCVTARDGLGLAPKDARIGDQIAILGGCPLPFVLRKKGDHYRMIGTAYIHGFMDGEALDLPNWKVEDVVLC